MKVVEGTFTKPKKTAPRHLPKMLRDLADRVDKNEVVDFVGIYVDEVSQEYCYMFGANKHDSLAMANLLNSRVISRVTEE